ncbi:signal peptide containing protein [Theileria equi strain WA]|uniref:Signal peptide containing protein n=1 Tax=Theileria equi strain WA TaxID=1537102 RepID=L1LBG9_THEEQ|nr:signal peptide containing protein [Theileria equi strain WA]EKX72619.1 signal peptide containing protein [Theileria equi strain WA]|eukprot:XP_004832071.1 signal peptide containing protein [Theileria equi strain WA]
MNAEMLSRSAFILGGLVTALLSVLHLDWSSKWRMYRPCREYIVNDLTHSWHGYKMPCKVATHVHVLPLLGFTEPPYPLFIHTFFLPHRSPLAPPSSTIYRPSMVCSISLSGPTHSLSGSPQYRLPSLLTGALFVLFPQSLCFVSPKGLLYGL